MKKLFFIFVLTLLPLVANADDSGKCGDNVYYSYNSTTHTLTISGEGPMSGWDLVGEPDFRPWRSYLSGIYSIIIESGVTSIGWNAFSGCGNLTSVTIPNSVTWIEAGAFAYSGLSSITIPDGVRRIESDDWDGAFQGCTGLTSITIPNSVTIIDNKTFKNCSSLISITIPNSVTYIGNGAFSGCSSLESITVENGNSFYDSRNNCNAIIDSSNHLIVGCKNTIVPNSVTSIGDNAFQGCADLTSITIPNSVTSIGDYAFHSCTGLSSITIPNSVTFIDDGAFMDCTNLTLIISEIENPFVLLDGGDESPVTYPFKGVNAQLIVPQGTKAKYQATAGWNRFFNIVESSGKWGNNVFYDYNAITYKLTISGEGPMWNIEDYDEHPWRYSTIKILEIEPGVTSIGNYAFSRFGITSVSIPSSVKSIGVYAFLFCGNLASVTIPNSVSSISLGAFQGCGNLTRVVSEIENPFAIDNTVFANIPSDAQLIVPKGTIGKYKATAGWNFTNIVEATGIDEGDFSDNGIYYNIKSDGSLEVTGLATWATIADIPSSIIINSTKYRVTSIGERAFEGRSNIEYLSIPYTIKSIGEYAFIDCGSNMTVNIADPESWCQMKLGNEHSSPLSSAKKVLVFDIETEQIDIPEGVTSIGNYTFYQCRSIKSLTIPSSVSYIGSSAFEDCTGLTSLSLTEGLETIGGSSFQGCTGLQKVKIPSTVKSIYINAFAGCKGITDVYCYAETIPETDFDAFDATPTGESTLHVPADAIEAYRSTWPWSDFKEIVPVINMSLREDGLIYSVKDDGTLEVIGLEAEVTTADIPSFINYDGNKYQVTSIGERAFEGRSDITYLSIPFCVTSIGKYAFIDCGNSMTVSISDLESWCNMELGNEHSSPLSSAGKVLIYDKETDKITIPEGVTSIGNFTFYQCRSITSLVIPSTVLSVGSSAFEDCSHLTSLNLSEGLRAIGGSAFEGCSALESLTIPQTVSSISINAFKNCKGITDVFCYAEDIPETNERVFDGTPIESAILHVPTNAVEAYKAVRPWSDFKEIVALDEDNPDGIYGVWQSDVSVKTIYSIRGEKMDRLSKGINIVKMKDGTVKKVFLNR